MKKVSRLTVFFLLESGFSPHFSRGIKFLRFVGYKMKRSNFIWQFSTHNFIHFIYPNMNAWCLIFMFRNNNNNNCSRSLEQTNRHKHTRVCKNTVQKFIIWLFFKFIWCIKPRFPIQNTCHCGKAATATH